MLQVLHEILIGDIVRHFKWETLSDEEKEKNKYVYQVLALATHTETGEELVIYQDFHPPFKTYARPRDMFMSEVDHDKYPDIKQKYRLERIERGTDEWHTFSKQCRILCKENPTLMRERIPR